MVPICLPLVACIGGAPSPISYLGPAPACGRSEGGGTAATLTRLKAGFAFVPYDGSLVVNGSVAGDGSLAGTLALRPGQAPSANGASRSARPLQTVSVTGRITGEMARVAYAAPGCADTLMLTRVHPPLL